MERVKHFLLFCSGADRQLLEQCPTDENKYMGIGGTVFFTGLLAFFSAGYAIYTVFDNYFMAVLFGLIWGLMIFNLDRYIVSSMKSRGAFWRDFVVAFPRLLMAVLLALVISKPLELKIFEKEINAELLTMEQEVYQEQEEQVRARYTGQLADHRTQIDALQSEIDAKVDARDTLALMALQEADGTGGSGRRNLGPIYKAKKADADKAQTELAEAEARLLPLIAQQQAAIDTLQAQMQGDIASLERSAYGGLAARMEALHRLGRESEAIFLASIFITLLFVAVETAPIFVKLISRRSPYDLLLHQHEFGYEMAHLEQTSLLNNEIRNKVRFDTETKAYRTQQEIELEKEMTGYYLEQRRSELTSKPVDWKEPLIRSQVV